MKKNLRNILLGLTLSVFGSSLLFASSTSECAKDNTKTPWWLVRSKNHCTPRVNTKLGYNLKDYNAIYVGNTSEKIIYLTFDEGYENGYTPKILDILKANKIKASFFVTSPYIKHNPELIKRMAQEGHIVGNHSNSHCSMPTLTSSPTKFNSEIIEVANQYKTITEQDMPHFFRPPMGEYSEKSLALTKSLGYTTVFWSFAYHDWDINHQPTHSLAKNKLLDNLHPGAIYLLHAVSKTNTEVLDDFIKQTIVEGYHFDLLPQQ